MMDTTARHSQLIIEGLARRLAHCRFPSITDTEGVSVGRVLRQRFNQRNKYGDAAEELGSFVRQFSNRQLNVVNPVPKSAAASADYGTYLLVLISESKGRVGTFQFKADNQPIDSGPARLQDRLDEVNPVLTRAVNILLNNPTHNDASIRSTIQNVIELYWAYEFSSIDVMQGDEFVHLLKSKIYKVTNGQGTIVDVYPYTPNKQDGEYARYLRLTTPTSTRRFTLYPRECMIEFDD